MYKIEKIITVFSKKKLQADFRHFYNENDEIDEETDKHIVKDLKNEKFQKPQTIFKINQRNCIPLSYRERMKHFYGLLS